MKPIIKFYATVLSYLQSEIEEVGAIEEIVGLAKETKPSLEVTLESISLLEKYVNRPNEIDETEDDSWLEVKEEFVCSAFKDLSALRDPGAMNLWHQINQVMLIEDDGDLFMWSKKTKSRPDGSAVIVLHVSNEEYFDHMLEGIGYEGLLDEGALFRNAGPQN